MPDLVPESALTAILRRRLQVGPISVADYMRLALAHPRHGYYRTRDPLGGVAGGGVVGGRADTAGRGGDFVTAPEVSQMFGELIGLWAAHVWGLMGKPDPVALVELGPGRGTLMADAMRAVRRVARGFHDAVQIHLVETSPVLRQRQRAALPLYEPVWHDSLRHLPQIPAIVIGNEFLDALPIHQLVRQGRQWHERQVSLDTDGSFAFTVAEKPSALARLLAPSLTEAEEGALAEVSPAIRAVCRQIARHLTRHGGVALLIDYGYAQAAPGDTLQAIRAHRFHPVLADPGEADITAHVDFGAVAAAGQEAGLGVHGPVSQGNFLVRLGILQRAERLLADAREEEARSLTDGLDRLISPERMGSLFKVIAYGPSGLPALPGFVA